MITLRSAHVASLLSLVGLASSPLHAGGSPERAVIIVDPTNPDSLYVANYYRNARDIPDANVIYMSPTPSSYAQFTASTQDGFRGTIENQRIGDHADYIILPPGSSFYVDAPGLVSDQCSPVNRFSSTAPFALSSISSAILAGNLPSSLPNGYYSTIDLALAFDGSTGWMGGTPSANGTRYTIAAMLGYTGSLGNTIPEVLAMIDRSVAVDGTRPGGTFYFMHTSDATRSGPRDPYYPAAVSSIQSFGGMASLLFADLPLTHHDCLGIMTGLSDPPIDSADIGILPGAFCDHLTSYAAAFDINAQTKMSRWIAKGASGTSGAIEEPCNYAGKFPHARLHVFYDQGLSLGEAWFRSLAYAPFQTLFTGDPLTRPFAYLPSVSFSSVPNPASGFLVITPSATTAHPTAHIASYELLIDGRSFATASAGHSFPLDTTALADGWHDLRVLAYDDTTVKSTGRAVSSIVTNNHGRSASLSVTPGSGTGVTQRWDFNASASGTSVTELRLVQGSRVIASSASSPAILSVYGRTIGAGSSRIQLEAQFSDGLVARSAPVALAITGPEGIPIGQPPVAFSYTKHMLTTQSCAVELPATFDDALSGGTWTLLTTPAQATVQGGGSNAYRILKPSANASGTDTFTFRASTPSGSSNVATVTLVYDNPAACTPPANYCTSTPNSTGANAFMSSSGSVSIGANDLTLLGYQLPANKLGVFIMGSTSAQTPLANGFLCVGSPFQRLGTAVSEIFGDISLALDFTAPPFTTTGSIAVGATRKFQLWYRDPAAGGGFSNLTDGLSVTFCQ